MFGSATYGGGICEVSSRQQVMFWFIFLMAAVSGFLTNDTVAITGTQVALYCAACLGFR